MTERKRGNLPDIYVAPSSLKKTPSKRRRFENLIKEVAGRVSKNPLSAFVAAPDNVSFETQSKGEQIILLLRRHWIVNVPWILVAVLFVLAPLCLSFFPLLSFLPARFKIITIVMWYLFILSFLFEKFLWWFFNVYIITDKRVVDIDFYSLAYKEISEAEIDKIQDITYKTGGLSRAAFNFGTIFIQTAGTTQQIEFEDVPQPAKVVKILSRLTRES